jgi:hypothetical protein
MAELPSAHWKSCFVGTLSVVEKLFASETLFARWVVVEMSLLVDTALDTTSERALPATPAHVKPFCQNIELAVAQCGTATEINRNTSQYLPSLNRIRPVYSHVP